MYKFESQYKSNIRSMSKTNFFVFGTKLGKYAVKPRIQNSLYFSDIDLIL